MKDYHGAAPRINIFYSQEDEGYIADIPDLVSCSAFGENASEALIEVLKAKDAWLQVAKEQNKPVPSPQYRPLIYQMTA